MRDLKDKDRVFREQERRRKWERGVIPPRVQYPGESKRQGIVPYLNEMSYADYISTPHWRLYVRHRMMWDSDGKCQICGGYSRILEVVHVNFKNVGRERDGDTIIICPACNNHRRNRERERELEIRRGIAEFEADAVLGLPSDGALEEGPVEGASIREVSMHDMQCTGEQAGEASEPKGC